ncbi:helix-turn-helix domain-containing protein [Fructilactobacillus fructivorans]|nr:helix-turn-helix domain-containing protein [Fructilactobacillus fructivorans]MCT0151933.1 helix-turn-helix domain-containing protein [Fructilactobacillus fructivorans]MCT2868168.1 helix-turn-helix domain-containing protein [Fructilactobacillus fructivorans]MCT2868581.1 helix-turn-helix domain-containing protein [Fructilactobacillus fructivorans]MCT2873879.1 helix-turn-helix domain-containing protein [Fructilactobacillus fructivorans]
MTKFSYKLKMEIVKQYLNGDSSIKLCRKYGIRSCSLVLNWVDRFKQYGEKGLTVRSIQRKYSSADKQNILNWMKLNCASYPETALHFDITSPSLIYRWQRSFELYGISGLDNKRLGRPTMKHKKKLQPDKTDRNVMKDYEEMKRLKDENMMLKIQNEYLKKLNALDQDEQLDKKHK